MRKIFVAGLLALLPTVILAQFGVSYGVTVTSLSTSGAGAVTGTPFALPTAYAGIVTWQLTTDGSPVSVNLEGSNDNSSWSTVDSATAAGIKNYGWTAVKYVRCSQVSRTGGTFTTCTIVVNRSYTNQGGGGGALTWPLLAPNGTAGAPSYSFTNAATTGLYYTGTAMSFAVGGTSIWTINSSGHLVGSTDNLYDFGQSGALRPRSIYAGTNISAGSNITASGAFVAGNTGYRIGANVIVSGTAPTISSGFGTTPTISGQNGPGSFRINVGTGGTATQGVIGLPSVTTGWNCHVNDLTAAAGHTGLHTYMLSSTTTTATIESQNNAGAATAWAASSILSINCLAY